MDLSLSPELKAIPRKGRRAALNPELGDGIISSLSESFNSVEIHDEPIAPPRSRKTGVWGDDNFKSAKSLHSTDSFSEAERYQSFEQDDKDMDDDIPLIPDIDDNNDDLSAEMTVLSKNRIESLTDLETDLRKKLAFSILEDINLGKLTRFLHPEEDIREADVDWSWDLLFTEVSSELRNERDVDNL